MPLTISRGTPIVWGQTGALSVTHVLSINGLADGSARMGQYADLGAEHAEEFEVYLMIKTGTAPTAGNTVDLYLVCTNDLSNWPGKVTGSDASYTLGTSDANLRQCGMPASCLVATNDANTTLIQSPTLWVPKGRYVTPILDNNLGQAIVSEGTASNNPTKVILIPRNLG